MAELLEAIKQYLATSSNREFLSILGSAALAIISLTTALLTYLSNRALRDEVEGTRNDLKKKEIEHVRLSATVEEQQKALDRYEEDLNTRAKRIAGQEENRRNLLQVLQQSDEDLWIRHVPYIKPFPDYDARVASRKLIVLTVANNKGGVGKSAVTLNMAAHFDAHPIAAGKKRLLIDMDYQGTLSYVLTSEIEVTERASRSQMLMTEGASELALFNARLGLNPILPNSELVPSFYELARHEDRLLMEWLLGEAEDDLRYRLANVLHRDNVASQYDLVLIDAPPRLTTGTMNALCASTHLIVPTAFTAVSAEPVGNFLAVAKAVKAKLNPHLKMVGVVETLKSTVSVSRDAKEARELARITVQSALRRHFPDSRILERDVPRMNALIEEGIAYQADAKAAGIFEQLCNEIEEELT